MGFALDADFFLVDGVWVDGCGGRFGGEVGFVERKFGFEVLDEVEGVFVEGFYVCGEDIDLGREVFGFGREVRGCGFDFQVKSEGADVFGEFDPRG